jgi:hypothetical protein
MGSTRLTAAALLLLGASAFLLTAQEAEDKDDADALKALGEKCKDVKTLHAVMLVFDKDVKGADLELEGMLSLWYDRAKNFLRLQTVDEPWVTEMLINEVGCVVWRTDTRTRRIQEQTVGLGPAEPFTPRKDKLAPALLGVPGFLIDGLLGYGGIISAFEVKLAEREDGDVRNVKWFSLKPRPDTEIAGEWRPETKMFIAVDEATGLLAAWVVETGGHESKARVVSIETDFKIDGAIFKVPREVRNIGLKDPKVSRRNNVNDTHP